MTAMCKRGTNVTHERICSIKDESRESKKWLLEWFKGLKSRVMRLESPKGVQFILLCDPEL